MSIGLGLTAGEFVVRFDCYCCHQRLAVGKVGFEIERLQCPRLVSIAASVAMADLVTSDESL